MILRFLKDYRSRQWMCRYPAGAIEVIDRPDVIRECLEGGFAEVVRIDETERAIEPEGDTPEPVSE